MSNRWCIVAGPRSGSTWLELLLIEHLTFIKKNPTRLGEFFHLDVAKKDHYMLVKNYIIEDHASTEQQYLTDQEIYNSRLSMLTNNDRNQSLTMRLFPQNYIFNFIDYINLAKKIQDCDFKFISLYRNIFERAISWAAMDQSSIMHLFKTSNSQIYTTTVGTKEKTTIEPFRICPNKFTSFLLLSMQDDISRRIIDDVVDSVEINYDNLIPEIQNLGINVLPTNIYPVHEISYDKLIKNYDQLLDIFHKLKTTRDFTNT
jgi:hypothetical protein